MVSDGNHEAQPRDVAENHEAAAEGSASPRVTEESNLERAGPMTSGEASGADEAEAQEPSAAPATTALARQGKLWAALVALAVVFVVALAGITGLLHGKKSAGAAAPPVANAVPTQPVPPTAVVSGGSVAAVVNGHSIPMADYRTLLDFAQRRTAGQPGITAQTLGPQVMTQLIDTELIREYAAAHNIHVSSAEVNKQVQSQAQQLGGQKVFLQRLAQVGLTLDQYKSLVQSSILGQKVEQKIAPLQPVKAKPVPVAHVRHILIAFHPQGNPGQTSSTRSNAAAKARAQAILNQIQHGGSFAALARKNSDDPGSASAGGDLGNVYSGQTVPEFNHAAFTAPTHHPVLVRTVYGYHIVEVLSRGKGVPPSQNPQQAAQQAQQQRFLSWLNKRMKTARIQRIAKVQG